MFPGKSGSRSAPFLCCLTSTSRTSPASWPRSLLYPRVTGSLPPEPPDPPDPPDSPSSARPRFSVSNHRRFLSAASLRICSSISASTATLAAVPEKFSGEASITLTPIRLRSSSFRAVFADFFPYSGANFSGILHAGYPLVRVYPSKLISSATLTIDLFFPEESLLWLDLGQVNRIRSTPSWSLARTHVGLECFFNSYPAASPTNHNVLTPSSNRVSTSGYGSRFQPVFLKKCINSGHLSLWACPNLTALFAGPILPRFYTVGHSVIRFSHRQKLPPPTVSITSPLIRFSHRKRLPPPYAFAAPSLIRFSNRQKLYSPSASLRSKLSVDALGLFVKPVTDYSLLGMALSTFPLYARGGFISCLLPGNPKNVFTDMFSCVAVCSGPEETYEFVSTNLGGRGSPEKSLVTKSRLSGFTVKSLTHLRYVSNPLSIFQVEDLSAICFFVLNLCCSDMRGCLIPFPCTSEL